MYKNTFYFPVIIWLNETYITNTGFYLTHIIITFYILPCHNDKI